MRDINEITFDEFFKMMVMINNIADEDSDSYNQMLLNICRECRLATEMFLFICETDKKTGKFPELAVEHHKVILAVWLLINEIKLPNTTLH